MGDGKTVPKVTPAIVYLKSHAHFTCIFVYRFYGEILLCK